MTTSMQALAFLAVGAVAVVILGVMIVGWGL